MIGKISGDFYKPFGERTPLEKTTIRNYYPWLNQEMDMYPGPSGKKIYVEEKKLTMKGEMTRAISRASKDDNIKANINSPKVI